MDEDDTIRHLPPTKEKRKDRICRKYNPFV